MKSQPGSQQERIRRLLDPERVKVLDAFMIFNFCGIDSHDEVVEVGCGPGVVTIPLAKTLSYGKVHSLDILEEMVEACRQRVKDARLGNVQVMQCDEYDFPVKKGTMDGAFIAFVIHQVDDRRRFLNAVKERLRPGAWCCFVEYYRKPEDKVPPQHRIQHDELEALAKEAGLESGGWRDLNGAHYVLRLRNPS